MRQVKLVMMLALSAILLALMTVPAMAYTIDGDLSDWGLGNWYQGLNGDYSLEPEKINYWVPSSSTCYFVVEDNRDSDYTNNKPEYVWPAYKDVIGVHITGTGSSYGDYNEPLINGYAQPSGGEIVDIEAMYFDSDESNAYFAIITSVPPPQMGDLKIVLSSGTYGIVLPENPGIHTANVYRNANWQKCSNAYNPGWDRAQPLDTSADFRINPINPGGTLTGTAEVAYVNSGHNDNAHNYPKGTLDKDTAIAFSGANYIIEIRVPRSALGSPAGGQLADLYATLWCGNDPIELKKVEFYIPEFTTIAIPAALIIGLFYLFRRKKQSKGE